jgi:hypothetical protein
VVVGPDDRTENVDVNELRAFSCVAVWHGIH